MHHVTPPGEKIEARQKQMLSEYNSNEIVAKNVSILYKTGNFLYIFLLRTDLKNKMLMYYKLLVFSSV